MIKQLKYGIYLLKKAEIITPTFETSLLPSRDVGSELNCKVMPIKGKRQAAVFQMYIEIAFGY